MWKCIYTFISLENGIEWCNAMAIEMPALEFNAQRLTLNAYVPVPVQLCTHNKTNVNGKFYV